MKKKWEDKIMINKSRNAGTRTIMLTKMIARAEQGENVVMRGLDFVVMNKKAFSQELNQARKEELEGMRESIFFSLFGLHFVTNQTISNLDVIKEKALSDNVIAINLGIFESMNALIELQLSTLTNKENK